jgi:hypothetical protein
LLSCRGANEIKGVLDGRVLRQSEVFHTHEAPAVAVW